MKNIEQILADAGVETTDDQKKEIVKAVGENYKTVADWEKQRTKAQTLEKDLGEAGEKLKGLENVNPEALKEEIDRLKGDLEQKDKEFQQQIADRDFDEMLKAAISSAKGKNAKAITALLDVDTLKASKNQKEDIAAALKTLSEEEDSNAYKTAGMSANAYMETVTSFSASLLQSLDNDTAAAAEKADQAITDMSDNANKMGTSMEMIQNAYQGFAKQNYTMLDNLKLGYGGTKEEMQRLLEDAEKLSGIKYDISSFADIVDAIHVVQTEMGITGTTAKEAATTIEGSLNSAKAAWSNLVVGIADDTQDFDALVNNFVDSVATAAENILPRVETAVTGVGTLIEKLFPVIMEELPGILNDVLPELVSSGINMVSSLSEGIEQNLPLIAETAIELGEQLTGALIEAVPEFITIGLELIAQLAVGIAQALPELMPKMVEAIDTIVLAIQENLPLILDAGIQILLQLALGIAQALPELLPAIVDVVLQIVETLINNIDLLVEAAVQLMTGLALGLIGAIPVLIEKIPEIISNLVTALIENAPKLVEASNKMIFTLARALIAYLPSLLMIVPNLVVQITNKFISLASKFLEIGKKFIGKIRESIESKWEELKGLVPDWIGKLIDKFLDGAFGFLDVGTQIVQGIWDGISSGWDWLVDKVSGLSSDLIAIVKDVLKIHSPSKEFAYIGRMCVAGFDEGIDELMAPDGITRNIKASLSTLTSVEGAASYKGREEGSFTQILNINREIATPDELARAVRIESRYGLMKGMPYGY